MSIDPRIKFKTLDRGPTITPHSDLAKAAIDQMRAALADRMGNPGVSGMRARLQCRLYEAYGPAIAHELDGGADTFAVLTCIARRLGDVLASAVLTYVEPTSHAAAVRFLLGELSEQAHGCVRNPARGTDSYTAVKSPRDRHGTG